MNVVVQTTRRGQALDLDDIPLEVSMHGGSKRRAQRRAGRMVHLLLLFIKVRARERTVEAMVVIYGCSEKSL